ncbi:hypothetical protein [Kineosporia babensis]|uniref:Uncharacterized protein n=1 Tax=Kineosporia babensis TaxID=499548 RepID=A0A9X1SY55_9ACTN|nr:hypothetical protein [Kineosporia babensis]MCD5310723.1 hypothetical protein [Kineosporia babensis]
MLIEALAAVDGLLDAWAAELQGLRERGAFRPTGVRGAYRNLLPAALLREAAASVYAESAHRIGLLDLDRSLPVGELARLKERVEGWTAEDRSASDVIASFGEPSIWTGSRNPLHSRNISYAADQASAGFVCFHLWNTPDENRPEPVLLAVRNRSGPFSEAFSFTPEGMRQKNALVAPTVPSPGKVS